MVFVARDDVAPVIIVHLEYHLNEIAELGDILVYAEFEDLFRHIPIFGLASAEILIDNKTRHAI